MNGTTAFLCDVIRCQLGSKSIAGLRKDYADGKYPGLPPEWAKFYGSMARG